MLLSIHGMGAAFFQTPELAIEPVEAKALIAAIERVDRHYKVLKRSGKAWDWINLCVVAGGIYGTRFVAIRNRIERDRPAKAPQMTVRGPVPSPGPVPAPPAQSPPTAAPARPNGANGRSSPPARPYNPNDKPAFAELDAIEEADQATADPRRMVFS